MIAVAWTMVRAIPVFGWLPHVAGARGRLPAISGPGDTVRSTTGPGARVYGLRLSTALSPNVRIAFSPVSLPFQILFQTYEREGVDSVDT